MNALAHDNQRSCRCGDEERRDLRSYQWGACLALLLTLPSFALVHWALLPRLWLLIVVACLALAQVIIHFRFFLHIGFQRRREDLQLILFSVLLLTIMVAGTIWIMVGLATRMSHPRTARSSHSLSQRVDPLQPRKSTFNLDGMKGGVAADVDANAAPTKS